MDYEAPTLTPITEEEANRRAPGIGNTLYEGKRRRRLASGTENHRVRSIYWQEKMLVTGDGHPMGHGGDGTCKACGDFRGDLARDWIAMVEKARTLSDVDLRMPGGDPQTRTDPKKSPYDYAVDAARVRIREFEAGNDQSEWVLTGLETTIAERRDRAYPAGAYRSQRRLFE